MWVILFNAVDDFGVREANEQVRMGTAMQTMSGSSLSQQFEQIEPVKHKLLEEALHGALRIAGLVRLFQEIRIVHVCSSSISLIDRRLDIKRLPCKSKITLCANSNETFTGLPPSPLRLEQKLDPAVMHFSCLTSGSLLARLGRPEVSNCIGGLKQYSYAYEEAGEEAVEMERVYQAALAGEADVNHMASVVLPSQQGNHGHAMTGPSPMTIDPTFGGSAAAAVCTTLFCCNAITDLLSLANRTRTTRILVYPLHFELSSMMRRMGRPATRYDLVFFATIVMPPVALILFCFPPPFLFVFAVCSVSCAPP